MQDFPNIIYNIKNQKYDQFGVFQYIKYFTFFYSDVWFNKFELFLKKHGGIKMKNNMIKISYTDLIEWLSICDSNIDLLTRYQVSGTFPFNLCYASLVALKSSIQDYKTQFENN